MHTSPPERPKTPYSESPRDIRQNSSNFHVWTFAYDVGGMQSVTLKYRTDFDGINPIGTTENDTYAGGNGVSSWQSLPMTLRNFPMGNVTGNSDINFFILPDYIADQYSAEIVGLHDTLVDYYVEAVDVAGNIFQPPIQHVYVGASNPGGVAVQMVFSGLLRPPQSTIRLLFTSLTHLPPASYIGESMVGIRLTRYIGHWVPTCSTETAQQSN